MMKISKFFYIFYTKKIHLIFNYFQKTKILFFILRVKEILVRGKDGILKEEEV